MFCKYCGTEIADDSVFCVKCGQKIQENAPITQGEKCNNSNSIRVQLVTNEGGGWKNADNFQWVKPLWARVMQTLLLIIGLFFLCYGIIWCYIIEKGVQGYGHFPYYPYFKGFTAYAHEPLGIIDIYVDLEKDDPNYHFYEEEWNSLYFKQYVDKEQYKEWGIDTAELTFYHSFYGDQLTLEQSLIMSCNKNEKWLSGYSIPYDYLKYYYIAEQLAVSKFRTRALLLFILPALILIVLSIIWIIKTVPESDKKAIFPRDYADKIEVYSWNGFTFHKYIRFIKNEKYGILDAANRSVILPATFELIEWREKNKSYDGVFDGTRKTYYLNNN